MTASIVLAVGVSIISIALKQLQISTVGRESQYAFYAANTGAECALYWDFHGVLQPVSTGGAQAYRRLAVFSNPFARGSEVIATGSAGEVSSVACAETELAANRGISPNSTSPNYDDSWVAETCPGGVACSTLASSFTVFLARDPDDPTKPDKLGPCARVTVTKTRGTSVSDGEGGTVISPDASGSNLETVIDSRGYNFCDQNNPRRVERGLRYTY